MDEVLYILQVAQSAKDVALTISEERADTSEGISAIGDALARSKMVFVENCVGGQYGGAGFSWGSLHSSSLVSDHAEVFCQSTSCQMRLARATDCNTPFTDHFGRALPQGAHNLGLPNTDLKKRYTVKGEDHLGVSIPWGQFLDLNNSPTACLNCLDLNAMGEVHRPRWVRSVALCRLP